MDGLVIVSVVFTLAFVFGWKFRGWIARKHIDSLIKIQELKERENVICIRIEHEQGCYYAYNLENNSFMGQGESRKELEYVLRSNYPGKTFVAEYSNLVELGFAHEIL